MNNNKLANDEYRTHYAEFSQNVAYAARTWHYHIHLNKRAEEDSKILAALNKAARFWLDQRYSAVQTTIIFLGKIFDTDPLTHNIDKTLLSANNQKDLFGKTELRKRKIELAGEFDGLDEYIQNATELSSDDLKNIRTEIRKAKIIWERIKPLRDQVYAHNQMLSDTERAELYANVKYEDINKILQILLNVSNALWQAEHNGHKPDFQLNFTKPINSAQSNIEELIASLLNP